jgi:hypothetical protein
LPKSSDQPLELERDVPTTRQDVAVLRRLWRDAPSWLSLTPAEIVASLPKDALDRRPSMPPGAEPFTFP